MLVISPLCPYVHISPRPLEVLDRRGEKEVEGGIDGDLGFLHLTRSPSGFFLGSLTPPGAGAGREGGKGV